MEIYLADMFNWDYFMIPFGWRVLEKQIANMSLTHQDFKRITTINCWHISEHESDGMWKLYMDSNNGLAVQTTIEKLINSLDSASELINTSKVRYLDYESDIWYHDF